MSQTGSSTNKSSKENTQLRIQLQFILERWRIFNDDVMDYEFNFKKLRSKAVSNRRVRGHELIPKEIRCRLPEIGTTKNMTDAEIVPLVKLFLPRLDWYWYVYEVDQGDHDTLTCCSMRESVEDNHTVSLLKLEAFTPFRGGPIERDLSYVPQPLDQIKAWHRQHESEDLRDW